jgi:hypothetical protein
MKSNTRQHMLQGEIAEAYRYCIASTSENCSACLRSCSRNVFRAFFSSWRRRVCTVVSETCKLLLLSKKPSQSEEPK